MPIPEFRCYQAKGFATPTGKVELRSTVLEDRGFDPLPYYRDLLTPTEDYPYRVATGAREDPSFQTGQRNIEVLRKRMPTPLFFLYPTGAQRGASTTATGPVSRPRPVTWWPRRRSRSR